MNKKIILTLLLSTVIFAGCAKKDEYVSKRHTDNSSEITTDFTSVKESLPSGVVSSKASLSDELELNRIEKEAEDAIGTFTVDSTTNLRQEPSTDSEIVTEIEPGTVVDRLKIEGDWSFVKFGDFYQGYVLTELLKEAE